MVHTLHQISLVTRVPGDIFCHFESLQVLMVSGALRVSKQWMIGSLLSSNCPDDFVLSNVLPLMVLDKLCDDCLQMDVVLMFALISQCSYPDLQISILSSRPAEISTSNGVEVRVILCTSQHVLTSDIHTPR